MALYTSDRERRLWLWTLVVLTAIYSTLWVTPSLTGPLRERNLVRISVAVYVFAVVVAIAVQAMRGRPDRREIGVLLGVAAVYLWAFFRMQIPEERTHLIEYGLVAVLIHQALVERRSHGRRVPASAALGLSNPPTRFPITRTRKTPERTTSAGPPPPPPPSVPERAPPIPPGGSARSIVIPARSA